jgi:NADPH-dependent 2,4-dienoyl-CoA reductase/sulfur reductase-like enzyme
MLRREGYAGSLTMISADDWPPYDRPNLSKDFLAGAAPDEWMRLRVPDYYREQKIDLMLNARVSALDIPAKQVHLENGAMYGFESLLIATESEPVRLQIEGATDSQVHYLRTFADARAIVSKAAVCPSRCRRWREFYWPRSRSLLALVWNRGGQLIIHNDVSPLIGQNSRVVETKVVCVGSAAHGQQYMRSVHFRLAVFTTDVNRYALPRSFECDAFGSKPDMNTDSPES